MAKVTINDKNVKRFAEVGAFYEHETFGVYVLCRVMNERNLYFTLAGINTGSTYDGLYAGIESVFSGDERDFRKLNSGEVITVEV